MTEWRGDGMTEWLPYLMYNLQLCMNLIAFARVEH